MNKALPCRPVFSVSLLCLVCLTPNRAAAVEALLLQDTYVDSNPARGASRLVELNYGRVRDLDFFKGNGQLGRAFLKFSSKLSGLIKLPPMAFRRGTIAGLDEMTNLLLL
ncbi:MAG TPA: hypothetical protein VGW57_15525 [Chthoniobacterales bacterium]|nr:hypothetical protein [Chthoniobacterales bacterium]